jgi:hypothetical protein
MSEINKSPPKCVNCENNHLANYRGCTFYKAISKSKNKNKNKTSKISIHSMNYTNTIPNVSTQNIHLNEDNTNKHYTYASACNNNGYNNSYKSKSTKNIDNDNDFMKTLLPLINIFVTQLM